MDGVKPLIEPKLLHTVVERYEGQATSNGLPQGSGVATFRAGHTYEGEFCQGYMHGLGKYSWVNGLVFEGQLEWGSINGDGTYSWPDGATYTGQVKDGKCDGSGQMVLHGGKVIYNGSWRAGRRHGQGTLLCLGPDGSQYEGSWEAGKKQGWGTMTYHSGNHYSGGWHRDQKTGEGVMVWQTREEEYRGEWARDLPNGLGQYFWWLTIPRSTLRPSRIQQCNYYVGAFKDGLRSGYGRFHYANGASYEGLWNDNRRHGRGVYILEDGTVLATTFKLDRPAVPLNQIKPPSPEPKVRIADLIAESFEDPAVAKKQVASVLLRYMSELRSIYDQYAQLPVSGTDTGVPSMTQPAAMTQRQTGDGTRESESGGPVPALAKDAPHAEGTTEAWHVHSFRLCLAHFWRLLQDCRIPTAALPLAVIDTLVARAKRLPREIEALRKDMAAEGHTIPPDNDPGVHDPGSELSFVAFCEALVRVAHVRLSHLPSLERRVHTLFAHHIVPNAGAPSRSELRQMYEEEDVQAVMTELDEDLYAFYQAASGASGAGAGGQSGAQVQQFESAGSAEPIPNFHSAMSSNVRQDGGKEPTKNPLKRNESTMSRAPGAPAAPSSYAHSLARSKSAVTIGPGPRFPANETSVIASGPVPLVRDVLAAISARGVLSGPVRIPQPEPEPEPSGEEPQPPQNRSSVVTETEGEDTVDVPPPPPLLPGCGVDLADAVEVLRIVQHPGDLPDIFTEEEAELDPARVPTPPDEPAPGAEASGVAGEASGSGASKPDGEGDGAEREEPQERDHEEAPLTIHLPVMDAEVLYPEFVEAVAYLAERAVPGEMSMADKIWSYVGGGLLGRPGATYPPLLGEDGAVEARRSSAGMEE
ncbi:unnamed protein product [Pedinophyceae sp. YPF-701]|nr:unnamed protein product [Pedinophyceae sp. YPF-701]